MAGKTTRILGIDPGLATTGWGLIQAAGNALSFIDGGVVKSTPDTPMADRLAQLHDGLLDIIRKHQPDSAAVEEVFVNDNARTSLKLGQARGIALLLPRLAGLSVAEYSALEVKKSVVGYGRAEKNQVAHMVKVLLPTARFTVADTADALAVAICHAHMMNSPLLKK